MFKPKLTWLLVTMPLLALTVTAIATKPVLAAGAAEEAVRILSRARAADNKCSYLTPDERNELQRYAARAEIAAASQGSASAAKSAAAAGRADGAGAYCSPDTKSDVRETLTAARQAIAATKTVAEEPKAAKPKPRTAERTRIQRDDTRNPSGDSLGFYTKVVQAYYFERQCKSLPRADGKRFWRGIVRLHHATVAQNGKRAVAEVMARAESKASGTSCGSRILAEIRRGYGEVSSR